MRMMRRVLVVAALTLLPAPLVAQDDCRLCFAGGDPADRPLTIEISADLAFSRLALTGREGGSAEIDSVTGSKRTAGGMIDLGGMSVQGQGRITGAPRRAVRVDLPQRVMMTAADGTTAELTDFTSSLPPFPTLDAAGTLEFTFGGRIKLSGKQGGNFRGRIPISVDYN